MQQRLFTIAENREIAPKVFEMHLAGDTSAIARPGQFVNIKLGGFFLRRPISVFDWEAGMLKIIYKVVGHGTAQMSALFKGQTLDVLTGLGNGYTTEGCGARPLLLGGGAGVPPMYALAKQLLKGGVSPVVILGFNTQSEIFGEDRFRALGVETLVCTADGSAGLKGFVTDGMAGLDYTYTFACGPEPMLRAVYNLAQTEGQYSFEARMGCGFGACMGCSCKTLYGNKRICKEGPVLKKEEILWA